MIFYLFFLIFSLSIILLSTDRNCYSLNNDFLLVFFSIIIILVCGFRFGIGTDYGNYINIYNNLEEYPRIEKGFLCIIKISKFLRAGKPQLYIFLVSLVAIGLKILYFTKLKNPFLAVFIYLCLYLFPLDFNVIRQGLASGIIYFAIERGRKKKKWQYFILVICASLFHSSVLIFLPLYPLTYMHVTLETKKLVKIFLIFLVIRVTVLQFIFNNLRIFILTRISNPLIAQLVNYFWLADFKFSFNFLRRLLFIIFYFKLFGEKKHNCYFLFYLIGFFISTMLTGNEIFSYRLSTLFDVFSIPLFCNKRIVLTKKNSVYFFSFIMLLILLYFSYMKDALPYKVCMEIL